MRKFNTDISSILHVINFDQNGYFLIFVLRLWEVPRVKILLSLGHHSNVFQRQGHLFFYGQYFLWIYTWHFAQPKKKNEQFQWTWGIFKRLPFIFEHRHIHRNLEKVLHEYGLHFLLTCNYLSSPPIDFYSF